jgi:hypothetical protein
MNLSKFSNCSPNIGEAMTETLDTTSREPLTLTDRCDTCSAAAKVVATFLNGELMFCGHHAKDLKQTLSDKALTVWDPESVLI